MKIRVEVKNKILGDSIFWEGDSEDVDEILNFPARELAKMVKVDGGTKKNGMWVVSEVKETK